MSNGKIFGKEGIRVEIVLLSSILIKFVLVYKLRDSW